MKLKEWLRIALISIYINKIRSILVVLSIFIGIGTVISFISIGSGAKEDVLSMIKELGVSAIWVSPEYDPIKNQQGKITLDDIRAIENLPYVESVTPIITLEKVIKRGNIKAKVFILGATSNIFVGEGVTLAKGELINELQIKLYHRVCILGEDVVKIFFGKEDPLGKTLKIGGEKFRIIGVITGKEVGLVNFGGWSDDKIFVPITLAFRMNAKERENLIEVLKIQIFSSTNVANVSSSIVNLLKQRHCHLGEYKVELPEPLIETCMKINQTLTLVGVAIACISLLVGGIGIMNMMLTSVLERRREIGIRVAVGAKRKDIIGQFLIEAITISFIGGILGIGGGILIANIVSLIIKIPAIITLTSIIVAVGFSLLVGIFAGIYPAYKASKLDPIVALRYE